MLVSNQFNYNDVRLHYVKGPDNGPPLVLLHGLSDCWKTYLNLIPFILPYYTLYIPDLRGHGKSYRAESYKIIDYTYDIGLFLSSLFNEPVSIIGHSLGAAVALAAAAESPQICRSISLIEPFVFEDRLEDKEFHKYFNNCLEVCEKHKDVDSISKNLKETGTLARKRALDLLRLDKKTITAALDGTVFDGFNLDELLLRVECPVLVLRGDPELDAHTSKEKADYLAKRLSSCIIEYLENSSHVVHVDQPFKAVQFLLNFLNSI